ncbi:unnamed protein product [Meloidogyne enterolobii]|uniref:Uncharacterized protein n=1 Tax=Meloidogyne enterolobii TaxID=390850 RepID=A0ACB0ZN46_MELEN
MMIAAILFTFFVINNVLLENYTEGKITFTDKTKLPKIGKLVENIKHEKATEVLRLSGEVFLFF